MSIITVQTYSMTPIYGLISSEILIIKNCDNRTILIFYIMKIVLLILSFMFNGHDIVFKKTKREKIDVLERLTTL